MRIAITIVIIATGFVLLGWRVFNGDAPLGTIMVALTLGWLIGVIFGTEAAKH